MGEGLGYLLTAAWTVVVSLAAPGALLPRPVRYGAVAAALLIVAGVLDLAGVPGLGLVNVVGHVVWSAWLIVLGVRILRTAR